MDPGSDPHMKSGLDGLREIQNIKCSHSFPKAFTLILHQIYFSQDNRFIFLTAGIYCKKKGKILISIQLKHILRLRTGLNLSEVHPFFQQESFDCYCSFITIPKQSAEHFVQYNFGQRNSPSEQL